ncbi:hypothetical protein KSP40_PGU002263 [Platanthera guangdongensis]|uniref:Uncharacterized protein n=1 Tax=Platanthera guangdongensis TaxID=2320717 RepID=A0ABR2LF95_9ASPA
MLSCYPSNHAAAPFRFRPSLLSPMASGGIEFYAVVDAIAQRHCFGFAYFEAFFEAWELGVAVRRLAVRVGNRLGKFLAAEEDDRGTIWGASLRLSVLANSELPLRCAVRISGGGG